jgi:DNA-binding response OmpR family regulator
MSFSKGSQKVLKKFAGLWQNKSTTSTNWLGQAGCDPPTAPQNGEQFSVQPRVIETLLVLAKNPHCIVDKETILDAVWSDVAEKGGLTQEPEG